MPLELRRIELRAFRMQSEHSTTELQPLTLHYLTTINIGAVYSGMELHDISFCSPNKRSGLLLVRDKYLHLSRQNP